eukprot:jgi/Phyca11/16876/fgenesh1_pg.PHYCAscaffold_23_\
MKSTHLYEEMDVHVTNDSEMATNGDREAEVGSVENGEVNGDGTKVKHLNVVHGDSSQHIVVRNVEDNHRMMATALEAIALTMADDGIVTMAQAASKSRRRSRRSEMKGIEKGEK